MPRLSAELDGARNDTDQDKQGDGNRLEDHSQPHQLVRAAGLLVILADEIGDTEPQHNDDAGEGDVEGDGQDGLRGTWPFGARIDANIGWKRALGAAASGRGGASVFIFKPGGKRFDLARHTDQDFDGARFGIRPGGHAAPCAVEFVEQGEGRDQEQALFADIADSVEDLADPVVKLFGEPLE